MKKLSLIIFFILGSLQCKGWDLDYECTYDVYQNGILIGTLVEYSYSQYCFPPDDGAFYSPKGVREVNNLTDYTRKFIPKEKESK